MDEDEKFNVSSVHGDVNLTVNIIMGPNKMLDEVLTMLEKAQEIDDVIADIRKLKES